MQRETFIIGSKEYAASKIPPFQANLILLKLKKIILPVLASIAGNGGSQSIMDMDLTKAASVIADNLNESVMNEIVMPMFKLAQVASITDNIKIDSEINFNKVFADEDGLADFYELVFLVLKYNFGNFLSSLANRFGGNGGAAANS